MQPMKATPVAVVPEGPEWLLEAKFDGWRGILRKYPDGTLTLCSSTGKSIHTVPYITDALANMPDSTVLDGEVVNLDGTAQWNKAQKICSRTKPADWVHVPTSDDPGLTFVAFDLLELMGRNLHGVPLSERKELLRKLFDLMPASPYVQVIEELPCQQSSLEMLVLEGYEGVVIKRRDSRYLPGGRNGDWLKCKPETEIEVEITGFYDPEPGSKYEGNAVGGFTFRVTHADGKTYDGRCGTGMDNELREAMREDQARVRTGSSSEFVGKVAELKHWGVGDTGALRFPSLKRIRDSADKEVPEVVEQLETAVRKQSSEPSMLLDRALDAEEKLEQATARIADLETRLGAAVNVAVSNKPKRMRNYAAMGAPKLTSVLHDLRRGAGDGYERALEGSGDPARDLRVVEDHCRQKGLI